MAEYPAGDDGELRRMITIIDKPAKVCVCKRCGGKGAIRVKTGAFDYHFETCTQCEGSGRVTVSSHVEYEILPYKPKEK